jgi:hypothetical protein
LLIADACAAEPAFGLAAATCRARITQPARLVERHGDARIACTLAAGASEGGTNPAFGG